MASRSKSRRWPWLAGGIGLGISAFLGRTRDYDRIAPELRSPIWRLKTPSLGPLTLHLARLMPATIPVDGVVTTSHVVTSADGAPVTVYVYRPAETAHDGPALLYTHGGGLVFGSAPAYHATVSAYARDLGIIVASVEYRLAPEHPFPTPLDDVQAAYMWLRGQAGALEIDASRIAVGGESAGGGLTAALCQRLRDAGAPMPVFQLLIYAMLDDRTTLAPAIRHRGQLVWTEGSNLFGWTSYLGRRPKLDDAPPYAAPARHDDLSGLPPAWIGVGDLDLFLDENVAYAERLQAAGVPCDLDVVTGAYHGFDMLSRSSISKSFRDRFLAATRRGLEHDRT